jgi:hypothetical protein
LDITKIRQLKAGEMDKRQLRLEVGRVVGLKTLPRSPLTKTDLNSIHFYLTGECAIPMSDVFANSSPHFKSVEELRVMVADCVGVEPKRPGSEYNRDTLVALVRALRKRDDQRPFAQP